MSLLALAISLVISYFLGSLPFGYIIGRLTKGVDVRLYGSGKTGATNVLRTVGVKAAVLSFILDIGKAAGAVFITGLLMQKASGSSDSSPLFNIFRSASGMAAITGHNWPVFLKFKGGRGVVPTMGAFLVLAPLATLGAAIFAFSIIAIWRFVSLGSILGAASLAFIIALLNIAQILPLEILIFSIICAALIIVQHKDNISRLMNGTERKLGEKVENI